MRIIIRFQINQQGHGRRQGHEDRRPAHQAGSVTKAAGPIRQEAQRRRQGHWEGCQIQGLDAGSRGKESHCKM